MVRLPARPAVSTPWGPPLRLLLEAFRRWWAEFTLQTKLLALSTLAVSLIMTGLTFFALNGIQMDARMGDTRYARDVGLLLAANVTPLVANGNDRQLARVAERFWRKSSSLRYILFADPEGVIYLGLPYSKADGDSELLLIRRISLPQELYRHPQDPLVRQHLSPDGQVTDVFVPLMANGKSLGFVALGFDPNEVVLASAALTREVTVAVFIAIWALVILGAVFNALTITRPVKELLRGVRRIGSGAFDARISVPVGGELGELLQGFNAMASQLQDYDAANIEELRAAQVKQQSLIATMADGAILLDSEGQVVLVNPTARRLFRWEARRLEGEPLVSLLPEDIAMELASPLRQLFEGKENDLDVRSTLSSPSRTLRFVLVAVKDQSSGNLKGITITIQDLTREVELNAAKSRFISNVSHELRTPLFNIKSYVETLFDMGDQLSAEQQKEFLGIANNETDRLTRLVNDVLDLSRLESNHTFAPEPLELRPAMEQTLRSYRLNAHDKGVSLHCEMDPDLPRVQGNWDLLLQVFDNLVGNGLKFTAPGGAIVLRAYLWPDSCPMPQMGDEGNSTSPLPKLRVEISDTGVGMNVNDQSKIFERFFRCENTVHTEVGTGLGLSIVRNIIEKHGSEPRLVSEPGVGTTFWFDLPIEGADADELWMVVERRERETLSI